MKKITDQLIRLSEEQELAVLAKENLAIAMEHFYVEEPQEYSALFGTRQPKKVPSHLYKQSLIFHHAFLEHYYMDTEYRLTGKDGMEAGSYRLITDLNGALVDDYLVFES